MKTGFLRGFFLFVFLLAAVQNVIAQAQQVQLTEEQQTALIVQSARKIKELNDKGDKNDVRGMIRKGAVELNGPAHNALKNGVADNRKGIEGLRKHTQDLQLNQQTILAAQILVGKGIKVPTDPQIAEALVEAKKIGEIVNPLDRTKALVKALTLTTEDPRIPALEKALAAKADKKAVENLFVLNNDLSAKVDGKIDEIRNDLTGFVTTEQVAAVANSAKSDIRKAQETADGAKKTADEVGGKVTKLEGEIAYAQGLAEATSGTLVEVLKNDQKAAISFYYRLSKNGACFADIEVTLTDIQVSGLFGTEPDSVKEFQEIIADDFKKYLKMTSPEAETRAKGLTAGMKEAK